MKKDWPNMSDKELDDFFRKGLEAPEIPFVKEDWEKMEDKIAYLPVNNKAGGFFQNKWLLLGLGLLLVGAFSWWGIEAFDRNSINESTNNKGIEKLQEEPANPSNLEQIPMQDSDEGLDGDERAAEENQAIGIEDGNSKEDSKEISGTSGQKIGGFNNEVEELNSSLGKNNNPGFSIQSIDKKLPKFEAGVEMDKEVKVENSGIVPITKPRKRDFGQRWSFSLLLSPDVSALKLNEVRGLGTSAGLNLEYYFLPKWSLNLGALYAFKTYESNDGYQFSYPSSKPTTGLEGECYVLDIPLNIRFYAINGPMDRWYISSGLSSYLMLREKYKLINGYSSYYPNYENLDIKNKNKHYFQVVNISMGYERRLSEKLSIQVEPYFKLPINGVGEGQVSLKSAGALIGLKYNW